MSEMLKRVGAAILEAESRWTPKAGDSKERAMALAAIEALRPMGRDDLLRATDDKTLVGLVMTLTGGGANPVTAYHHLERLRAALT